MYQTYNPLFFYWMTLTTYKKILKPKTLHESKKMYLKFRYKGIALMLFDLKMGLVKVILGSSFFMSHMVIHFHAQITGVFSLPFSIFGPHFKSNQIKSNFSVAFWAKIKNFICKLAYLSTKEAKIVIRNSVVVKW